MSISSVWLTKYRSYSLPILSGLLLTLTLPPYDISILSWIGLVPFFFFINQKNLSNKDLLLGSGLAGCIYALKILYPLSSLTAWWWVNTNNVVFEYRVYLLYTVIISVALVCGGGFFALFGYLYRTCKRNTAADMILFGVLWALLEYLREFMVFKFTWGELGYSLHNNLHVVQVAHLSGVYGLSFLIVATNIGLYLLITAWYETNRKEKCIGMLKNPAFYFIIILIGSSWLYGYYRIYTPPGEKFQQIPISVIHSEIKTEDSQNIETYEKYLKIITEASAHTPTPTIVVLPENTFPFFIIDEATKLPVGYNIPTFKIKPLFDQLLEISKNHPTVSYVIGIHTIKAGDRYNSLVVLEHGTITDIYNKRYLLPLAEQSPDNMADESVEPLTAGLDKREINMHGFKVTPLVCSEIMFPNLAQNKNSSLMINIGNDSIFDNSTVGLQDMIMAQLRAVENNVYVLRSVKGGISSVIDPFGKVVTQSDPKDKENFQILYSSISLPPHR